MVTDYRDRQVTWFAADYAPQPKYHLRFPEMAQMIKEEFGIEKWFVNSQGGFLMPNPSDRLVWHVTPSRVTCHTLGADVSGQFLHRLAKTAAAALSLVGVGTLARVGFKTSTYLSLKMTHPELVELMFGSYLVRAAELERLGGQIDDLMVQLYGTRKGLKYVMTIAPQTAKQVEDQVKADPQLDHFVGDKWNDPTVRKFLSTVSQDILMVDVDFSVTDHPTEGIEYFLTQASSATDEIIVAAVDKLLAKD